MNPGIVVRILAGYPEASSDAGFIYEKRQSFRSIQKKISPAVPVEPSTVSFLSLPVCSLSLTVLLLAVLFVPWKEWAVRTPAANSRLFLKSSQKREAR